MNSTNPAEYLIAFGVTFLAGVVSTIALQQYTKYVRNSSESKVA